MAGTNGKICQLPGGTRRSGCTHILRIADGAEMMLYLIRHGRTEANERWLYCGSTDLPLSEAGIESIKKCTKKYPIAHNYYTSGMKRTEQTLQLLYGTVAHTAVPALREMDFGAFEMHSYEELKQDARYLEWIAGDNFQKICPNGESGAQMTERVCRALREIAEQEGDSVIVTHGGVISAIMDRIFPEAGKNRYEWQPAAAEGYAVDLSRHLYYAIPE